MSKEKCQKAWEVFSNIDQPAFADWQEMKLCQDIWFASWQACEKGEIMGNEKALRGGGTVKEDCRTLKVAEESPTLLARQDKIHSSLITIRSNLYALAERMGIEDTARSDKEVTKERTYTFRNITSDIEEAVANLEELTTEIIQEFMGDD